MLIAKSAIRKTTMPIPKNCIYILSLLLHQCSELISLDTRNRTQQVRFLTFD